MHIFVRALVDSCHVLMVQEADVFFAKGNEFYEHDQYQLAIEQYNHAIGLDQHFVMAHLARGKLYFLSSSYRHVVHGIR